MIKTIRRYEGDKGYERVCFSNPPAPGYFEEFEIIQRPEIPELENFVEHYLQPDGS